MENTMGQRIKDCRKKLHMTQQELGDKLGVQGAAIRKYEVGEVQNIPRDSIAKMAEIFDVRPSWLMGLDDETSLEQEELDAFVEELKNRPELKMLFSLAKNATKADVEKAVKIIELMQNNG